ncbi:hypothetical protein PLESTB_001612400 [Pleodorina starrii]|uniref:Uncharacterized protein n=1 Tax=Pleodorina starrii TaxID=330485 RepID=A0A9W6F9A6_9CHLO|nr:hypothetical protein PLESTB_001612400 [Pleodorina starrii]GLC64171.1 hypothetical protein PLESTF_000132300 [Pleodorina starrii]
MPVPPPPAPPAPPPVQHQQQQHQHQQHQHQPQAQKPPRVQPQPVAPDPAHPAVRAVNDLIPEGPSRSAGAARRHSYMHAPQAPPPPPPWPEGPMPLFEEPQCPTLSQRCSFWYDELPGDDGGRVLYIAVRGLVLPVLVTLRVIEAGQQLIRDRGEEWWRQLSDSWEVLEAEGLTPQQALWGPTQADNWLRRHSSLAAIPGRQAPQRRRRTEPAMC